MLAHSQIALTSTALWISLLRRRIRMISIEIGGECQLAYLMYVFKLESESGICKIKWYRQEPAHCYL